MEHYTWNCDGTCISMDKPCGEDCYGKKEKCGNECVVKGENKRECVEDGIVNVFRNQNLVMENAQTLRIISPVDPNASLIGNKVTGETVLVTV